MRLFSEPALQAAEEPACEEDFLAEIVRAAKDHLNADLSFLAQMKGETKSVLRAASDHPDCSLPAGASMPVSESYCHRLLQQKIPNAVADARTHPELKDLAVTATLDIGAYIGVPVILPNGELFGTLCCINREAGTVGEKDVKFLSVLADVVSSHLARQRGLIEQLALKKARINHVVEHEPPQMVFQPIVNLLSGKTVGVEALARFRTEPSRTPDCWFAEAWEVGLGPDLELCAVEAALVQAERLPEALYVSVNIGPQSLLSPHFREAMADKSLERVVFEVTEHMEVSDYRALVDSLSALKALGGRLAVDDVGAGYSGLSHILQLQPHLLKLDLQLTRDIHRDPGKQALVSAVVSFAARTDVAVVAEGIETQRDMEALRVLGVSYGQGYLFARPAPLTELQFA